MYSDASVNMRMYSDASINIQSMNFYNSNNDPNQMINMKYTTDCGGISVCCKNKKLCRGDRTNNQMCNDSCVKAYNNSELRYSGRACRCPDIPDEKILKVEKPKYEPLNVFYDKYKVRCGSKIICCKDGFPCHTNSGNRCNAKCANALRVKKLRLSGRDCEC